MSAVIGIIGAAIIFAGLWFWYVHIKKCVNKYIKHLPEPAKGVKPPPKPPKELIKKLQSKQG